MKFLFLILISFHSFAGIPVDVVFDIDLTIVSLVKDGPGGDLLADPANPAKGIVKIDHKNESYRVFQGVTELMEKLRRDPRVRVSFFSGGTEARNEALLRKIKLSDGTTLWDLSQGTVLGRSSMTPTGRDPPARIREMFKKDLTRINPDLSDVIIIDDIKEFVPESQRGNLLWLGEDFPFPDRTQTPPDFVSPEILEKEKFKFVWITEKLENALYMRFSSGKPLSRSISEITETPFTAPSITGRRCTPDLILDRLLLQ